jgi:hypothetical protein
VIYLDRRLFGAAGWRLSALAVDLVILQPAWRGFEAVERLERRIYTQFEEEAEEEGAVSCQSVRGSQSDASIMTQPPRVRVIVIEFRGSEHAPATVAACLNLHPLFDVFDCDAAGISFAIGRTHRQYYRCPKIHQSINPLIQRPTI